jgi:hypothetical protein
MEQIVLLTPETETEFLEKLTTEKLRLSDFFAGTVRECEEAFAALQKLAQYRMEHGVPLAPLKQRF